MKTPTLFLAVGLAACLCNSSLAQSEPSKRRATPRVRARRVQRKIEPAFRIKPFLYRYEARRGQLLKFEFEAKAEGLPSTLEIRAVAMKQTRHPRPSG